MKSAPHIKGSLRQWRAAKRRQWKAVMRAIEVFSPGSVYTPDYQAFRELLALARDLEKALAGDWKP